MRRKHLPFNKIRKTSLYLSPPPILTARHRNHVHHIHMWYYLPLFAYCNQIFRFKSRCSFIMKVWRNLIKSCGVIQTLFRSAALVLVMVELPLMLFHLLAFFHWISADLVDDILTVISAHSSTNKNVVWYDMRILSFSLLRTLLCAYALSFVLPRISWIHVNFFHAIRIE